MTTVRPRDIEDLHLAPVVLAVDARIAHLGGLDEATLAREIDAVGEHPTRDARERQAALLLAIAAVVDLHGWTLSWDEPRGIRLAHRAHTVILGVPPTLRRYVAGPCIAPAYR